MKRLMTIIMALVMMLSVPAMAADVQDSTYALAPANPTQENVKKLLAEYQANDRNALPCSVTVMEPTRLTVDTLKEIFDFVDIDRQLPARYFPEDVQGKIAAIIEGDPDRLYMPEFMSLLPEKTQMDASVLVSMHMYIDYHAGQLVVPVLGRQVEDLIEWEPLPAQVIDQSENENIICFEVPAEIAGRYAGHETLFALLAEKPGIGDGEKSQSIPSEDEFVPSKNASDIVFVSGDAVRNEAGEAVDCKIIIVPKTKPIEQELMKLTEYFTNAEHKPIRYFDDNTVQETALILKGTDIDTLLPYEITQVMVVDYQEPYGDVTARLIFPTPFTADKAMIALIGIPSETDENCFLWMPLRAEKMDSGIDITFSSSVLPAMMKDAALLLVMSEPIDE